MQNKQEKCLKKSKKSTGQVEHWFAGTEQVSVPETIWIMWGEDEIILPLRREMSVSSPVMREERWERQESKGF